MASWCRKRGTQVVVFIRINNKNKQLPRSLTKHLDGQPDHNVEHWIREWELKNGKSAPLSDAKISGLVDRYLSYCKTDLKRSQGTISEHRRHLTKDIIPFFLSHGLDDLNLWGSASVQMLSALREKGLTNGQIYRCNVALRLFYKWLAEERFVLTDEIMLRTPDMSEYQQTTPLKFTLNPEQVLDLANETTDQDFALSLLVGYFFILRSQELFGLKVGDFRIGVVVKGLECSKTMHKLGLFDGMAVHIVRQKAKNKLLGEPKNNSKGWVNCFNKEAAIKIIQLLAGRQPGEFILTLEPNIFYHRWPFKFATKDLRRASLYWLGHNTDMSIVQMMKHARQKSYEALSLYLRRPEESLEEWTGLAVEDL
jgi:hypothetical protein